MDSASLDIALVGERLTPDPLGALFWSVKETLIVSDLHFEKGSSFAARRGLLLPPYDTRTTLMRLEALVRRYQPARIISLGDAFHDGEAEQRMDESDAERLEALMRGLDWLWILGNHDPEPPLRFAGLSAEEIQDGPLIFRHEPVAGEVAGEIAGHLHPCARVVHEGRIIRRRCFAADGRRLIMPAMGAYTGGLNVLDEAFEKLMKSRIAWVLGENGVYPIGENRLASDDPAGRNARLGRI